jgi:hypothetical protein
MQYLANDDGLRATGAQPMAGGQQVSLDRDRL